MLEEKIKILDLLDASRLNMEVLRQFGENKSNILTIKAKTAAI